jgi:EAL domain-containing protein (putative c-di-GMP-specific phosphodiesterase class I)
LAEESSLILHISNWVLDNACGQLALWGKYKQTKNLTLAVNISAKQFVQLNFVDQIATMIKKHNIDASRLKLELTESVGMGAVVTKMLALRDNLGVSLSLKEWPHVLSRLSI